ncbi:DoxX family protein [Haloechinothrix halophila]|uniref:DoxX family protein n=1 Tax=Haloechinothrix halophila TaxID=1069073 RepID=UPI000429A8E9|nr:DoxX family protein [Haloechinothrix halophila]
MRTLLHPATRTPVLADLALLVSRVALGVILIAHGWQKFNEWTLSGTAAAFGDMGIPAPTVAATFATAVELLGGAALILGVLTPIAAVLNMVIMLGALLLVHIGNGVFVDDGGFELVLALVAGLLTIAVLGAGKFSIDGIVRRSSSTTTAAATR